MSRSHKQRGTRPPAGGEPWTAREDEAVRAITNERTEGGVAERGRDRPGTGRQGEALSRSTQGEGRGEATRAPTTPPGGRDGRGRSLLLDLEALRLRLVADDALERLVQRLLGGRFRALGAFLVDLLLPLGGEVRDL